MTKEIKSISKKVISVLKNHRAVRAGFFGSAATGRFTSKSDVDILVELPKNISLLGYAAIKNELEDKLGRKVDLVEYDAIKPQIRESIMKEQVRIL